MQVLVTGATGLVGRKLCLALLREGHQLIVLGRSKESAFRDKFSLPCHYVSWKQLKRYAFDKSILPKPDVVIHLAGESIATGSWTRSKKERIYNSRVETTRWLSNFLIKNKLEPKTFLSASAIGFYGDHKDKDLTEVDPSGSGFLAEVCKDWEAASEKMNHVCRRVVIRIGLVFDVTGGFLKEMEGVFNSGAGGPIGSGGQWLSWIHVDDLVDLFLFAIKNKSVEGPINGVAPHPVTNKTWTQKFSHALKVPAVLMVPKLALKLALGEKAILALQSQKVLPKKAEAAGFEFKYPDLEKAFKHLYSWRKHCTDRMFSAEQWVSKDINSAFSFFSEAKNLEKITPPLLNFKILNMSTKEIKQGSIINYKLKIHGVPAKWTTLIAEWKPPLMFVDNQEKGPYDRWYHTHNFEELAEGTLLTDQVLYRLPVGFLGAMVAGRFVLNDVKNIFSYRKKVIKEFFTS